MYKRKDDNQANPVYIKALQPDDAQRGGWVVRQNGSAHSGEHPEPNASNRQNSRVAAIVAVFLLIYIPSTFNWFSGKAVPTDILREGSLYEARRAEAIIVRNEDLIYSGSDGVSITIAGEGERVAGKSAVATVYNRMSYELMDKLKKINAEILIEQYTALGKSNIYLQEVESIENDISGVIKKMIPEINHSSLHEASLRVKSINGLALKRAEAYGAFETDDIYINQLKDEKRKIEDEVAKVSYDVYCESPGYLSFILDGLEPELAPEYMQDLSIGRYNEIIEAVSDEKAPELPDAYDGMIVRGNEPFIKIVKDNIFYMIIKAPIEFLDKYAAGDRIRIRTESPYREFENAEIISIRDNGLITVKLTKFLYDFLGVRAISVELVEKYKEGLKVPLKCLTDVDLTAGEANIALMKGSHASIRRVEILASNDIYAIIGNIENADSDNRINRYDTYIRDTENIEDGMQLIK